MKNKIKKAVSYSRVSTNKQIDNTSIANQEEKINLYCKLNDIKIIKRFKDEGQSAKSTDRENYQNMLNFIDENEVDGIIVMKSDRIHRSLKNLVDMMYMLQDKGVEFVSVTENFDTSTPQGMLMLQMLGSFSEFERKVIAERTKSGRIANANNKVYPGGRVPIGYKLSKNGKLIINKVEAQTVKEIFKLRAKGITFQEIANKFNFSKQRVSTIVKNPIYIGKYNYHGAKEKNNISLDVEPIVTKYMFNKANNVK